MNSLTNELMSNLLTDRDFWVKYWESKTDLSVVIPENYLFHQQFRDIVQKNEVKTAIELGGFPGYYAVFLKKYLKLDVTLLDYFVHPPITRELLQTNGLPEDAIQIIETDLFAYATPKQYDLVLSCGLIEHFNDSADIINRHIAFVKPGGTLFITLPNFKALNGWFQKKFDKDNYDKHNIDCMDPALLAKICKMAGLEVVQARYFGKFSLWLENEKQKSLGIRLLKKSLWLTGKLFTKVFAFNSKQLSPYILLEAKKQ
jgi:SAM-dependent methyltransferase